jgi:DNA-binding GntR family transcriptional regulator
LAIQKISFQRETLGEAAYRHLFEGFLNKELRPGTRLLMDELAEQMGISRTPVREALQRLEREGVIEAHGRRGYVVCETDPTELDQRYQAREAIEGYSVEKATALGGGTVARIRARYDALLQQPQTTPEEVFRVNREFHRMIIEEIGNDHLIEAFDMLWNRVLTADIWAAMLDSNDVVGDFDRAHRDLIAAIESGDPDRARETAILHIHDGRVLHEH